MNLQRNRLNVPGDLKRKTLETARDFRKNPTSSEDLLWQKLRGKQLNGIKFRRQQPIGPFVVDFYAPPIRLVIEIDGAVHQQQQEADQNRQRILESLDLKVLRFSASQVENDINSVLTAIGKKAKEIMETPLPRPLPDERGGEEEETAKPLSDENGSGPDLLSPILGERSGERAQHE